jgi:hypothetical protein
MYIAYGNRRLQYRVREQLVEEEGRQSELGQGFIGRCP